ncbi:hypothetical protein EYF80_020115 [Liparis tanakae]|uniref:Uncharacterized protein n=1 Tax=Liparis tanakae TaxID=230148 RepID=A0A4Z2HWC5_9TELE|nr:hypothetical protein EYF80_020115 [Liparis tanakae]
MNTRPSRLALSHLTTASVKVSQPRALWELARCARTVSTALSNSTPEGTVEAELISQLIDASCRQHAWQPQEPRSAVAWQEKIRVWIRVMVQSIVQSPRRGTRCVNPFLCHTGCAPSPLKCAGNVTPSLRARKASPKNTNFSKSILCAPPDL